MNLQLKKCPKCGEDMSYCQELQSEGRVYWKCFPCNYTEDIQDGEAKMNWDDAPDIAKNVEAKLRKESTE